MLTRLNNFYVDLRYSADLNALSSIHLDEYKTILGGSNVFSFIPIPYSHPR